jgi:hypothetical protein
LSDIPRFVLVSRAGSAWLTGLAGLVLSAVVAVPASAGAGTMEPDPVGSIGLRLVDVPVGAGDDPRAKLYIVDHLAPGAVINRRVEVSNTTDSTIHIELYAAAATLANGSFLGSAGRTANDLSTWTSVAPRSIEVPAHGTELATVTIGIPRDAAPGEQYGAVWAEARATPSTPDGVTHVSRVGIRLYLSVGLGGPPAADFTIETLTAERTSEGLPMIVATVENTGGRALDMNGSLRLSEGPGGLKAGPFPATLGTTLAIGDTATVTIVLDERVPNGPWDARVVLRSGLLERSAHANVAFPGAAPRSAGNGGGYVAIGVVVAVVLALALAPWLLRRRRIRRLHRSSRAVSTVR